MFWGLEWFGPLGKFLVFRGFHGSFYKLALAHALSRVFTLDGLGLWFWGDWKLLHCQVFERWFWQLGVLKRWLSDEFFDTLTVMLQSVECCLLWCLAGWFLFELDVEVRFLDTGLVDYVLQVAVVFFAWIAGHVSFLNFKLVWITRHWKSRLGWTDDLTARDAARCDRACQVRLRCFNRLTNPYAPTTLPLIAAVILNENDLRRVSALVTAGRERSLRAAVLLLTALVHTSRLRELGADLAHVEHVETGACERWGWLIVEDAVGMVGLDILQGNGLSWDC